MNQTRLAALLGALLGLGASTVQASLFVRATDIPGNEGDRDFRGTIRAQRYALHGKAGAAAGSVRFEGLHLELVGGSWSSDFLARHFDGSPIAQLRVSEAPLTTAVSRLERDYIELKNARVTSFRTAHSRGEDQITTYVTLNFETLTIGHRARANNGSALPPVETQYIP